MQNLTLILLNILALSELKNNPLGNNIEYNYKYICYNYKYTNIENNTRITNIENNIWNIRYISLEIEVW